MQIHISRNNADATPFIELHILDHCLHVAINNNCTVNHITLKVLCVLHSSYCNTVMKSKRFKLLDLRMKIFFSVCNMLCPHRLETTGLRCILALIL